MKPDLGFWNNRVIEFADPLTGASWFQIHEVFYAADGKPQAYGESPAAICGDTVEEMNETLGRMMRALKQPALRETDFTNGSADAEFVAARLSDKSKQ